MSTTDPILPQEIIDKIIEEVEEESTLVTCSTVSSSFREPAQKRIFRAIVIYFSTSHRDRNLAINEPLASNIRLCSYVEALIIVIPEHGAFDACLGPLPRFPRLSHMSLEDHFTSGVLWTSLPDRFKSDMRRIIQSATLRVLHIRNIHEFPISALRPCFQLDTLHIWSSSVSDAEPDTISSSLASGNAPERRYHHTVRLDGVIYSRPLQSALSDPSSPLYFASLEQLRTYFCDEDDLADCQAMLDLIDGSDIKELEFSIGAAPEGILRFPNLPKLRCVTFEPTDRDALYYISQVFESASNIRNLPAIQLTVDEEICPIDRPESNVGSWGWIDTLLSRELAASRFQFLKIDIVVSGNQHSSGSIREAFEKSMPRLLELEHLWVERDGVTIIPLKPTLSERGSVEEKDD